jgi:hypothetical protein
MVVASKGVLCTCVCRSNTVLIACFPRYPERTQQIPLARISGVDTQPIPTHLQYHIVVCTVCFIIFGTRLLLASLQNLHLGASDKSDLVLYWFPAQYVAALKVLTA